MTLILLFIALIKHVHQQVRCCDFRYCHFFAPFLRTSHHKLSASEWYEMPYIYATI